MTAAAATEEQQLRALGCFLGAAIGDAAGATLEFTPGIIKEEHARAAMRMPGGGVIRVGPGQITDDTELALAMADALRTTRPQEGFPSVDVALHYKAWYDSPPFDCGYTCRSAFGLVPGAFSGDPSLRKHTLDRMLKEVVYRNSGSQANGALMRATPLAVHGWSQPEVVLAAAAIADCVLSHPSQVCT